METRPPTPLQLLVAVAFAISCFGLLLFLWLAFGGPTPLKPESYRFKVPFDEATQLSTEADVRISGVSVGRVKSIDLNDEGLAAAELEIDERYAPIPDDTRATLRQKTLLGETYVELTPGSEDASPLPENPLPEGGSLPAAQVSEAVQLDEIFRTFDEPTREAFQTWQQDVSIALRHRGADLSAAIGNLGPFAADLDRVLRVLDSQRLATRRFVRDTGETFEALSERRGQLRGLITNSEAVFSTTAARNESLREAFVVLPTFLEEQRLTLDRLERFAIDTDPLVQQLRPAARELSPTLMDLGKLAPELRDFFIGFRQAANEAKPGFPALRQILDDELPPFLADIDPFLRNLTPLVQVLRTYRQDVTGFLGNAAAATQASRAAPEADQEPVHYLRTAPPLSPESVAGYPNRLGTNRSNPYLKPGGYNNLAGGLEGFETRQCTGGIAASLDPNTPNSTAFSNWIGFPAGSPELQRAFDLLQHFAFADGVTNSNNLPAPPCKKQGPYQSIGGTTPEFTDYLHVRELPP
ncbi:MAG TPA: MlaD family protein [Solirubrobacterales bacterium]|jgi:virulence factor Mce-like protein|nr:MlaD family protein [Solirubrobacterales bacterium]HZA89839.1 MlaD family protein [Solirubrobacterales bacterium]